MAWDVTVPDTYAVSHIGSTAAKPGAAANKIAENKIDKCAKLASTHIFYLFAVETAGTWHHMAIELTQEIDRRITAITEDTGKQHSSFNVYLSLCKWEMRSSSITLWLPNKMPLQPF